MKNPFKIIFFLSLSLPLVGQSDDGDEPDIRRPQPGKQERSRDSLEGEEEREARRKLREELNEESGAPVARSIDGYGNHTEDPALGMVDQPFARMFEEDYADDIEEPAGGDRESARLISNEVAAQEDDMPNRRGATDFLWQWGQFLDHDITETPTVDPAEAFDIEVPTGDEYFDPYSTGEETIPLDRSFYEYDEDGVRQQINEITAFIDASQVYGSDEVRALNLRKQDGSGEMKVTASDFGDLLPYNEYGEENAPSTDSSWFLAGDIRVNEQAALTAMHTLFVREHNHWAARFLAENEGASDDEVYEFARMIVGAEMQQITYREFLPILLGQDALPPYRGFREERDPTIFNEFATGAFRFGHSLMPNTILRVDADGETAESGNLELADAFFDPSIVAEDGIDNLLRGLAAQRCQELDGKVVDALRNFLFGPAGSGGLDLVALNLQRGRDHGLPSYNAVREALGMRPAKRFRDVNPDREVQKALRAAYDSVDDIDLWVGGLSEPHVRGGMVGPVFHQIISRQFRVLRDGDAFWYENKLPPELLDLVREQTLSKIIRRNTDIGDELSENVFLMAPDEDSRSSGRRRPR
ncbi:peroxidase family protein [Luteolibacter sp. AS25]|uniref:peroxidase family protein n=1 Tax=Luteolibacter sp. AS25 TaxID=3135776 RepID=UPI00398B3645